MKQTPMIYQNERAECGLACLAMLTGHWLQSVQLRDLRNRFDSAGRGLSVLQLKQWAEDLGFTARGVKLDLQHLSDLRLPALLHWELDHFVVLTRVSRHNVTVHDPAQGVRHLSWEEVSQAFTGIALEVWPTAGLNFQPSGQTLSLRHLWRGIQGERAGLWWVLVLSVALQLLLLAAPWQTQWTLDQAVVTNDRDLIVVLAVGFAAILLLRSLVMWLRNQLVIRLGHRLSFVFTSRLLNHLLDLPYGWFTARSIGDVAARFESLRPIREFITQGAAAMAVDAVIVVLSLVLMLVYAPMLAAVVVAAQLIYVLSYGLLVGQIRAQSMAMVVAEGQEQSLLVESIRTILTIKVYGQLQHQYTRWQAVHARTLQHSMRLQGLLTNLGVLGSLLGGAELLLVVALGALAVLDDAAFTVGMLVAFISYRSYFSERLRGVLEQWVQMRTLQVHLLRLADILLEEPEHHQAAAQSRRLTPAFLRMQCLSFRYSASDAWLLRDAELEVVTGEMVAIVGLSGSGKSTLLRLLMGLIPPTTGRVISAYGDVHGSGGSGLRQACGCVLQEDGFFSGSLLDNITLFGAVDMPLVERVVQQVGLTQVIEQLPMGLRTTLGDIEHQFSSGQMQRLFLARALYRRPDYLFLDEGTAHLDPQSALLIEALVAGLSCTRVVVTHNMAFARRADRVLLLEEGRLRDISSELVGS